MTIMLLGVAFSSTVPHINPNPAGLVTPKKGGRSHVRRNTKYLRSLRITSLASTFQDAIRYGYVKDFGRTIPINISGKAPLSNDLKVPLEHQESLQHVVQIILRHLGGHNLTAVFLRGSLATGHFLSDGSSDIDFLVFSKVPVSQSIKPLLRHEISVVLRASVKACKVDIAFHSASSTRRVLGQAQFNMNSELSTLLRHYSVPLYGTLSGLGVSSGMDLVRTHSVRNLPRDKRQFLNAWKQAGNTDFELQLRAVQWLCKRSLRAGADFFSTRAGIHCRDLVPCYHVCTNYLPEADSTVLSALQIACASESNNFAGLSRDGVIQIGGRVAWDIAEFVEDSFLKSAFSMRPSDSINQPASGPVRLNTPSVKEQVLYGMERWVLAAQRWSALRNLFPREPKRKIVYKRHTLPQIKLVAIRKVSEIDLDDELSSANTPRASKDLTQLLQLCSAQPMIVRNALGTNESFKTETTEQIVSDLLDSNVFVTCRLSNENVITFCRAEHTWIEDGTFCPPSRSMRMKTSDALKLLRENNDAMTSGSPRESIPYIQTPVREGQGLFQDAWSQVRVAQEERIWISGHGTVSCLHYDAAKSALLQRAGRKRLIFLPPSAIPDLGIYPLGHPLHRRARVSLSREDSKLFKGFWQTWGRRAQEVVVEPGDLLLFPPMWSHYTESLTCSEHELSISHTFRFW